MKKKQPIIFEQSPQDDYVEGEQTMDLLMHYAQSGIFEAERVMRETPDMFTDEEMMDFAANKVVLAKAPDVLDDYKKKFANLKQLMIKFKACFPNAII
ncbi:MAG: hypothetical protein HOH19_01280 [Kordiimonadaceae bacterium]|jgi:hypothetical protein|nr:hypothetical protein [Kordiimonadaceae bacterium]MBT6031179.1 hypothetical protein [Kordiimonadaceae bacterium]